MNENSIIETLIVDSAGMIRKEFVKNGGVLTADEKELIESLIKFYQEMLSIDSANQNFDRWKKLAEES